MSVLSSKSRYTVQLVVLGNTTVLPWNRGTSFSRYQYRRGDGTTVVPQYHKYRSTTVRYGTEVSGLSSFKNF